MADKQSREVSEISIKVNADMSEAITGFKALQRELRETTRAARETEQALRELGEAQKRSQALPRVPFVGHPNTSSDIPPHIKKYGKGGCWSNKGMKSNGGASSDIPVNKLDFDKSITEDIRRSYE